MTGTEFTEVQWNRIQVFNQVFSLNVAIRENRFKLINTWCYTPKKLARMYPQLGDQCWKCGQEDADYYHMWWSCPKVFPFWRAVGEDLSPIIGKMITVNPRLMLVLDMEYFRLQNYKVLLANLLTAASFLLAQK